MHRTSNGGATRIKRTAIQWRELPTLRINEVAEILGVSRSAVDSLLRAGDLQAKRIGRVQLVLTRSVIEWTEPPAQDSPAQQPTPLTDRGRRNADQIMRRLK